MGGVAIDKSDQNAIVFPFIAELSTMSSRLYVIKLL
jgi:hypothetical protein